MKPFYALAKALVSLGFLISGGRVIGRENIPDDPALLIICNHVSFGDPPAITRAFPRQITYIAKEEFSRQWWTRWLFGALGAAFLNKGEKDLAALRVAISRLQQGQAVAIFPEGTRHYDQELAGFQPGAAYIAHRAQVRVLPMAVLNTGDFFRFWRRNMLILIGEPLEAPAAGRLERDQLQAYTSLCQQAVAELVNKGKAQLAAEGKPMRRWP